MSTSLTRIMVVSISLCWLLSAKTHLNDIVDPSVAEKLAHEAMLQEKAAKDEVKAPKKENQGKDIEIVLPLKGKTLVKPSMVEPLTVDPTDMLPLKGKAEEPLETFEKMISKDVSMSLNQFDKNINKAEILLKEQVHRATFEAPVRHPRFTPAPSNQSRDGVVEAVVTTDASFEQVFWILLDTTNWWAWGADGWTQASGESDTWSASVPAGGYLFILADSFGDGGATASLTVNGEDAGSVSTATGDPQGPYEPYLFEASLGLTVTDADSSDDGGDDGAGDDGGDDGAGDDGGDDGGDVVVDATVTFNIDGTEDCGFVSVTGTWDEWSGWGAHTDTQMTASIPAGDHEFVILCVTTEGEWWNDIWANSVEYSAPIGGDCWNGNAQYANYTLTVGSEDMTVSYCAGTCDEVCAEPDPYADCTGNVAWMSDGYCDSSNNNEACGYDGGDCCESTCVDGSYSCDTSGGCNGECLDPSGNDDACGPPPTCEEQGYVSCTTVDDGSECTYDFWVCDGYADCSTGLDEADCPTLTCADQGLASCTEVDDGSECTYTSWVCDGMADCSTGLDEVGCAELTCEDQGLWDCGDGQCIPASYVCDGVDYLCSAPWGPDCVNGADEGLEACAEVSGYADQCNAVCNEGLTPSNDNSAVAPPSQAESPKINM